MSASPGPDNETVTAEEARKAEPIVREPDKLAFQELQNAHREAMNRNQRGIIGWLFGSGLEKPGNAAVLVVAFCLLMIVAAFFRLDLTKDAETFFKVLSPLLGLIGLALGYLFGSKGSD